MHAAVSSKDDAKLRFLAAKYEQLYQAKRFNEAIFIEQEALALTEKVLGPNHPETSTVLCNLAQLYKFRGDYAKAEPLYQRALKIDKRVVGSDHPSTATTLNNLAELYYSMGDYTKAEPLYQRALKIRERALGPEHPDAAASLSNLATVYREIGNYAKAEPLYQRALKITEKALGLNHPNTAAVLNNLALLYKFMGDYAKAEPLYQRALKIDDKALGPDHPDTAATLNNLAELYVKMGHYAKAEPLYQRALKIDDKALGPAHPHTATVLNNLALLYMSMGDYGKAKPLFQRALKIYERVLGPNHSNTWNSLLNLAALYSTMGNYAEAEPLSRRVVTIAENTVGPDHPKTATALNNLALVHVDMGDYAKAEPLYQRALRISERALGPNHLDTGMNLLNLAVLYSTMGDYAKAEPLYQRALKICEKALDPDHPKTATALNGLASLYEKMGDSAKAESLYQHALKIREKTVGLDHPDAATELNNLAGLYLSTGNYTKAEPLYQRALKAKEKAMGLDHRETAALLDNLARLYGHMGNYAEAEPLYQRALKIREKALGLEHPETATSLSNLASLYYSMGDYAKAEPLLRRALYIYEKVFGPEHPDTAAVLNNLAAVYRSKGDYAMAEPLYQRALKINEKVLELDHPKTATALNNLAILKMDLGIPKDALVLLTRSRKASEQYLANILSFTSEQERLAFQRTTAPYTLAGTLGVAAELAETILRQKGVVLDSLLEDRIVAEVSMNPKQHEIVERLRAAKQRLMQLVLEVPKDLSEQAQKRRAAEKAKVSMEVEQLEAGLAHQVTRLGKTRRALTVTVAQVQSVLAQESALVELLRYDHYLGNQKSEPRYGAVLIFVKGEPQWVPLGSVAEIEKKIQLYRKSARGETDEATLSAVLKTLGERVWAPIEKALPAGTTTVIVSPDAELSFVSFATLLTPDDRFVAEKYSIRYLASGRDLLRDAKSTAGPKTTMRVFANPDFALNNAVKLDGRTNEVAMRSVEMRDLQSISLRNLPGTEKESRQLEERATKSGWQAQVSLGQSATEAELRKVNSPRILHLATHGFFLPEIDLGPPPNALSRTEADIPKGKLLNPMHRSGLAVAGAQTTLQAWAKGEVPPTENDGIVTAEEVGGLKLDGTWLVVLSACDTGGGEAKAGEGVMGLRRGFVQSGAQNLLMTLWPISDETTVQIMLDFYDAAFKTGNAPQALADTQRDWLVKLRKERGLLAAVQLAGPFIMSS